MDATYRVDLRQLNELNFARFDATLEQRLAELQARIDGLEARLDAKMVALRVGLEAKIDRTAAEQREWMERALKELTRFTFVAWASLLIPIVGLWMRG